MGYAKSMYRCCPETCEAGELTEDDCNALSNVRARGNCDYADYPQICIRPPTFSPSDAPTTPKPTFSPSDAPTTSKPTFAPSDAPTTSKPTFAPSEGPTTSNPTFAPSKSPIITPQVTYTTHHKKQCPSNNWYKEGRYTFAEAMEICTADPNCRSTAYEYWPWHLYVKDPKPSSDCQVQDNDACIQQEWGNSHTCASLARYCDSYAKNMYRCCPETCEAGEL